MSHTGAVRKFRHTAGPWRVLARNRMLRGGRGPGYDVQQDCSDGLGEFICDKATHADAHLIAASPDLLNELGKIADALAAGETVVIEPGSVKAAQIAAAVSKAEVLAA